MVASLELLAALVGLLVFDVRPEGAIAGFTRTTAFTDNQGNGHLPGKCMTTKMPLGLILIELAAQLQHRPVELSLEWVPREQSEEADALTNDCLLYTSPSPRD